ncbi:hypothetical protein EB796_016470 [Bugula neritina]|uniref:Uncharacterized protein n=1 Tax=Bugula neritina TaxID=10212 RepID=A0A7J7JHY9_BUGNE|nr:hypothetical protein EB796_016470 [Bugula neritina]
MCWSLMNVNFVSAAQRSSGKTLSIERGREGVEINPERQRAARNTSATLSSRRKSASSRKETADCCSFYRLPSASSSKPLVTSTATAGPLTSQSGVKVEAEGRVGRRLPLLHRKKLSLRCHWRLLQL